MSEYTLADNSGNYLTWGDERKLYACSCYDKAARFESAAKAYNVLTCSIPKNRRKRWHVTEVPSRVKKETTPAVMSSENEDGEERWRVEQKKARAAPDWETIVSVLGQIYSEVRKYSEDVERELREVEMELLDCEHACEFFRLNAAKGYSLYSMIRERRIKRRLLKDESRKANAVLNTNGKNAADGRLNELFDSLNKQSYEPRRLKGLFRTLANQEGANEK